MSSIISLSFLLLAFASIAIGLHFKQSLSSQDEQQMSDAQTDFALRLLQQVGGDNNSVFFSPFSISAALAITEVGASGATKTQLQEKVFGGVPDNKLFAKYKDVLSDMRTQHEDYKLKLANRVYVEKTFALQDSFKNVINNNFNGDFASVDFANQAPQVIGEINSFVSNATNGKIPNLLDSLDASTRLVLINAIYFSGSWSSAFKTHDTAPDAFHISANKQAQVMMMKQSKRFNYAANDQMQMLSMPYKSDAMNGLSADLSMLIILPKQRFGLQNVVQSLTADKLRQFRSSLQHQIVQVMMPKFRIEKKFELAEPLAAMGVRDAFDQSKADFTAMVGNGDKISISRVIHQAYVSVDEQGSEAAAATAVVFTFRAAVPIPAEPDVIFEADHPFLFAITYNDDMLFLGRFAGPN